jgi:colanic acid biosynthesis glycosyl transferase WcaI
VRCVLLYHFFSPATVVSAVHYAQLAQGLAEAGHDVEVWPSNRERRRPRRAFPSRGRRGEVAVRRCWRPGLSQDRALGRVLNTLWMWLHWLGRAIRARDVDVVIVGTDPPMSVVMARAWRLLRPGLRIFHWSFDLYPDVAVRHGVFREGSRVVRALRAIAASGLRACDAIVDIGPCMRERTARLAPGVRAETIVPWAITAPEASRPPDPALRRALFGDARTVLLYAGHLGAAHVAAPFLALARELHGEGVVVAFQAIGEREAEIRAAARGLANVRFLASCPEHELVARLEAADFHLVSLREGWEGTVVPSKFFAALAVGRPVIFAGSEASAVARWIREGDAGVVIPSGADGGAAVATVREALARRAREASWPAHCQAVERARFSRAAGIARWNALVERPRPAPANDASPDGGGLA